MIINVSDYFKISIDELLKNDVQTVKKIDNEKKAKKKYLIFFIRNLSKFLYILAKFLLQNEILL